MICGLWLLWQLKMVKLNHRVFQASEHNMLQWGIEWTVNGKWQVEKRWEEQDDKLAHEYQRNLHFSSRLCPPPVPLTLLCVVHVYHEGCLHKQHTHDYLSASAKPEQKTGKTHPTAIHLHTMYSHDQSACIGLKHLKRYIKWLKSGFTWNGWIRWTKSLLYILHSPLRQR